MKHRNTWPSADVQHYGIQFVGPSASEEIFSITIQTEASISALFSTVQNHSAPFRTVQHFNTVRRCCQNTDFLLSTKHTEKQLLACLVTRMLMITT
jgi:hypothetical protein